VTWRPSDCAKQGHTPADHTDPADVIRLDVQPIEILSRDGWICANCGKHACDAHHRKTKARRGPDTWGNQVALCRACHDWAHFDDPAAATLAGLLIPSFIPDDKIETIAIPYMPWGGGIWVVLGDDSSINIREVASGD
jgi:hypothetical protein